MNKFELLVLNYQPFDFIQSFSLILHLIKNFTMGEPTFTLKSVCMKIFFRGCVAKRHCKEALMKHVFPKLLKPQILLIPALPKLKKLKEIVKKK